MIKLNKKTKQDFLSPERVKQLEELGCYLNDAKYCIIRSKLEPLNQFVIYVDTTQYPYGWKDCVSHPENFEYVCNTYTLPELLLKLPEWIGKDGYKALTFFKDAPFYGFYYNTEDDKDMDSPYAEYPLIAGYNCLLWCIMNNYGYVDYVGDKGDTELDIDIDNA